VVGGAGDLGDGGDQVEDLVQADRDGYLSGVLGCRE
jgi:hypothetical protein